VTPDRGNLRIRGWAAHSPIDPTECSKTLPRTIATVDSASLSTISLHRTLPSDRA